MPASGNLAHVLGNVGVKEAILESQAWSGDSQSGSGDSQSWSGDSQFGSGDSQSGSGDDWFEMNTQPYVGDSQSGSGDSQSGSGDEDKYRSSEYSSKFDSEVPAHVIRSNSRSRRSDDSQGSL